MLARKKRPEEKEKGARKKRKENSEKEKERTKRKDTGAEIKKREIVRGNLEGIEIQEQRLKNLKLTNYAAFVKYMIDEKKIKTHTQRISLRGFCIVFDHLLGSRQMSRDVLKTDN